MAMDPFYSRCARNTLLDDHECEADPVTGRLIEWEHALIHASNQVNEEWAIIPSCWWAHRGPGLIKEINVWIALNRATDEELISCSKAVDYLRTRCVLNVKYGVPDVDKPVDSEMIAY